MRGYPLRGILFLGAIGHGARTGKDLSCCAASSWRGLENQESNLEEKSEKRVFGPNVFPSKRYVVLLKVNKLVVMKKLSLLGKHTSKSILLVKTF